MDDERVGDSPLRNTLPHAESEWFKSKIHVFPLRVVIELFRCRRIRVKEHSVSVRKGMGDETPSERNQFDQEKVHTCCRKKGRQRV
jgi:hypothetical protein